EVTTQATSPLFFRDILGQERVLGYLKAAFNRGRLAHAYLFLGPEGVGKESVARALAAALNCADLREDGDACGVCPSCKRLAAGTHPDFLVIRPTSKERPPKIVIDQIRELRRVTAYPPVAGGWRVTLIKPGEDMRDDTANALLKTLEEPPPQHLLILTAGVEADIFPTVVSRCQKLAFTPLPYPLITAELQRRGLSPSQAALLAKKETEAEGKKEKKGGKKSEETDNFILLSQLWYRDLLLLSCGAPERLLAHQDRVAELQAEAASNHRDVWLGKLAALSEAQRHLRANLNPELTLDLLGFRLKV
ncbi:MAG: DNA polymerase III subunit delta', partial [Syntrophobacterales bacterium]